MEQNRLHLFCQKTCGFHLFGHFYPTNCFQASENPAQLGGFYLEIKWAMKKVEPRGCLGSIGDEKNTYVIWGLYLTSIRIPIRQPVEWKVRGFFVWLNLSLVFFAVNPSSSCCFPASSFLARELLGSCHHDAAKNKMNSGPKFPSFSEEWMPSCTSALGSSILSIWMKLDCGERRWVEVGWRGI